MTHLASSLPRRLGEIASSAAALGRAGLLRPVSPVAAARGAFALARDGLSPAAAYEFAAARYGDEPAIVDDRGTVSFARLAGEIGSLAGALEQAGVDRSDRVGLLCRNNRAFVRTLAAASALGADVVLLNVSFAAPQLARVVAEQGVTVLVHDPELAEATAEAPAEVARYATRGTAGESDSSRLLDGLPPGRRPRLRVASPSGSRFVLLTSGTTGHPRGAGRGVPRSVEPLVGMLSRIPLKVRDTVLIASPLFHAWGFAQLAFAIGMAETVVLQERFEPEAVLAAIAANRVRVLVAVPVMLQRLLELPDEVVRRHDLSSLEVVAVSGSALPADLAVRFMDAFGDVLYNLYGSTEAAWASIATPADLRAAPRCAGYPPLGTEVRVVDGQGADVAAGGTGRILVRNGLLIGTGGAKFFDTGDVGSFDESGRLCVAGRGDDMIVSGGENVYPQEVEEVIATHPDVVEASVSGVADEKFGQRLRAVVVRRPESSLDADEVRAFVRGRLARFKVPRDVEFVAELPRNAAGKVPRRQDAGG